MSIVTLSSIITKIRRLTGSANNFQLTDAMIADYINSFYLYDFPSQFRSLNLKDKFTFNTIVGVDTYPFDNEHYTTVEMPCYCMRREIKLFQDPWSFWGSNFNWQQQDTFAVGNGTTGPYSFQLSSFPLIASTNNNQAANATATWPTTAYSPTPTQPTFPVPIPNRVQNILITANTASASGIGGTMHVTDDGAGNLIGDCAAGGTINYATGAVSNLTFTVAIPSGNSIFAQYNPVTQSIPLSILFYQNQFTLRPVPNQGYTIEVTVYRQPSQLLLGTSNTSSLNNSGVPELSEWWELLAVGAAKKIFEDRLDSDGVALMDKMLAERYMVVETRTYAQLGEQRIQTLFADQLSYNYGSGGWGGNVGSI